MLLDILSHVFGFGIHSDFPLNKCRTFLRSSDNSWLLHLLKCLADLHFAFDDCVGGIGRFTLYLCLLRLYSF